MQDNLFMKIIKNSYMELLACSYLGDRKDQQDAVFSSLMQDKAVAIVADGMGGLNDGKCASNTAVRRLKELFDTNPNRENMQEFYFNAIRLVDSAVYSTRHGSSKSGTTLVSATVNGDRLDWLSIGDSRLYLIRDNQIMQLTRDHTLKNYIERNKDNPEIIASLGEIDEAKLDALTSYVGMDGITFYDINTKKCTMKSGDHLLLTSDGLYKGVEDNVISDIIGKNTSLKDIGNKLLEQAKVNCKGNQDNTSFIIIRYI